MALFFLSRFLHNFSCTGKKYFSEKARDAIDSMSKGVKEIADEAKKIKDEEFAILPNPASDFQPPLWPHIFPP